MFVFLNSRSIDVTKRSCCLFNLLRRTNGDPLPTFPLAEFACLYALRYVRYVGRRRGGPAAFRHGAACHESSCIQRKQHAFFSFLFSSLPLSFHRPLLSFMQPSKHPTHSLHNGGVKSETAPTFSHHHHSVKQVSKLHNRKFGAKQTFARPGSEHGSQHFVALRATSHRNECSGDFNAALGAVRLRGGSEACFHT